MFKHQKSFGHAAMLVVNIFFGINMSVSKDLLNGALTPIGLNGMRFMFGALAFWTCSLFFPEKIEKKDVGVLLLGALLGLVTNQILFVQGLAKTSPIDASIISTSLPIITMLLAAFMIKEPITWVKALGVLTGASGALYLVYTAQHETIGSSSLAGDLLCFGSCVSFALYLVVTKKLNEKYSPITMMKWMFLFASIAFLPFCYADLVSTNFAEFSPRSWSLLAFVLVCATFIPYLLIPVGQRRLRPTTVAIYNYIQPVVATVLAIYWGLDTFGATKAVAAALVFTGVFIVTRSKSRADLEAEKQKKAILEVVSKE